jgi:choline-glycine betaine transporter
MRNTAKYAIVINILLALIFVYSNFSLWSLVNGEYPYLIASHWSPLGIVAPHYVLIDGSVSIVQTVYLYWNIPFWIFWVLMIVNVYFILRIGKELEKQSQTKNGTPEN